MQALRALAYGLGSVLIGVTLASAALRRRSVSCSPRFSPGARSSPSCSAATATASDAAPPTALLLVVMALAGTVFALTGWVLPLLLLAGLTGTVSTDVVESGPFTSLEQAMLPHAAAPGRNFAPLRHLQHRRDARRLARRARRPAPAQLATPQRWLLVYPLAAARRSPSPRASPRQSSVGTTSAESAARRCTARAASSSASRALFALDSFGGGFVPQTFIAYLFTRKYTPHPRRSRSSSSRSASCRRSRSRSPSASPGGSGCCERWSSPTSHPTCS